MASLLDKIVARSGGIALYGISPPKLSTPEASLASIAEQQMERFRALAPDGIVVYDIQDESERTAEPRPFPFLPTLDPETYAESWLSAADVPKIVYRSVPAIPRDELVSWLDALHHGARPRFAVLVGAPSRSTAVRGVGLREAYGLVKERAPELVLGGIAIAERHARGFAEHERMLEKMAQGCRFFITQAVYDVTSTKSLLSDYALRLAEEGLEPVPVIFTYSPCGSMKTLEFMKWLGISFPRWLENDLRHSEDPLEKSVRLCAGIHAELRDYAREKGIPIGINVESVSIRKAEIEASVALFEALRG